MIDTIIVIPCFNEAQRLRVDEYKSFTVNNPRLSFILVNDGSTDHTLKILREMERENGNRFRVIDQQPNQGKAEAVRKGMLTACQQNIAFAGYWDADLATPLSEILRFIALLETHSRYEIVYGSRVKLLGKSISRKAYRHYVGRVFATLASLTVELPVYDTQCGAKLFRISEETTQLFIEPFYTRWFFDVELLARFIQKKGQHDPQRANAIYELPVNRWTDIPGSHLRLRDCGKVLVELATIRYRYFWNS